MLLAYGEIVLSVLTVLLLQSGTLEPRRPAVDQSSRLRDTYRLGAGDEITVRVEDDDAFGKSPLTVGSDGFIKLPLLGWVQASGRTLHELDEDISTQLKKYFRNPAVSIAIVQYRSQPVSVLGAVNKPGMEQLEGQKTLMEVIAMAGGLRPDAGNQVLVMRSTEWGDIPLPNATSDAEGKTNTVKIELNKITDGSEPELNLIIKPHDTITVPKGELVYVVGEVEHASGFVLQEKTSLTALEALTMAGGYRPMAAAEKARILRYQGGDGERKTVIVNLKAIAEGKGRDVALYAQDILYIPRNSRRALTVRIIETSIGIGTGLVIWRHW